MAEYREIFGEAVQSLPSSTGTIEGQIWYDSSSTNFKLIATTGSAAFATGGALPANRQHAGQAGTQTAAIVAGGQSPGQYNNNDSYTYDGSSWTSTPATDQFDPSHSSVAVIPVVGGVVPPPAISANA